MSLAMPEGVDTIDLPICLPLVADDGSNYTLCREALDFIADLPCPINVCTIFGAPRAGKTTVIQSIFAENEVDVMSANTTGNMRLQQQSTSHDQDFNPVLWIWNKPIFVQTEMGECASMLILESGNGTGAWKNNEAIVFALSVLLSDHVMYMGTALLDEAAIAELRPIRNLTGIISTKESPDQEEDGVAFGRFFPHLTWVIRDHPGLDAEIGAEIGGEGEGGGEGRGAGGGQRAAAARALALAGRAHLDRALRVAGYSDEVRRPRMYLGPEAERALGLRRAGWGGGDRVGSG